MIRLESVSKRYGSITAVDSVSFDIPDGTITGFVGDNGAGKSTVIRAIMGLVTPDSGQIFADSGPINAAYRAEIGYMPEEQGLYPEMPVRRQLLFFARIQGLGKVKARQVVDELIEALGLTERANDTVSSLSLGNRQRVQLISALVTPPRALILDEPFSGLDPIAVDYMETVLAGYARDGVPLLFSSHQLELVERLCDQLVVIKSGSISVAGDLQDLLRGHTHALEVGYRAGSDILAALPRSASVVRHDPENSRIVLAVAPGEEQLLLRDLTSRADIVNFTPVTSTLTEMYRDLVTEGAQ